jgi:hypothetical protein
MLESPAQVAPEQQIEAKKVDEPEVTTEVAAPVTTVGDVGKEQEGVVEAPSELGNFSMVEVPDETAILETFGRNGVQRQKLEHGIVEVKQQRHATHT